MEYEFGVAVLFDWLMAWLCDGLFDWLIDWMDCSIDWLIDRLVDWWIDLLIYWFIAWLVARVWVVLIRRLTQNRFCFIWWVNKINALQTISFYLLWSENSKQIKFWLDFDSRSIAVKSDQCTFRLLCPGDSPVTRGAALHPRFSSTEWELNPAPGRTRLRPMWSPCWAAPCENHQRLWW